MMPTKFGLIARIALVVGCVEIIAFGFLGGFYVKQFSHDIDENTRLHMRLVGRMIANSELAISTLSQQSIVSDLVGAPSLRGIVIGGNGRVIVSSDASNLGRIASSVDGIDARWLDDSSPEELFIQNGATLTAVMHKRGPHDEAPLYTTILTISTAKIDTEKHTILLWGAFGSLLFMLLSSAGITFIARNFITRRVDHSLDVLKKVENGDLEARIHITYHDEVGRLQGGINLMIEKVGALLAQHRLNEDEIRIQGQLLTSIIEHIPNAVFVKRAPDLKYVVLNRAWERLFGRSGQEMLGKSAHELFTQEQADFATAQDQVALKSFGVIDTPEETVSIDNVGLRILHTQKIALRDSKGHVEYLLGIAEDITERKQDETNLRIAATAFETQESLMITDANRVIIRVNQSFIDETGYAEDEIVGKTASILKSGRHDVEFYRAMWQSIRDSGRWQGKIWDKRKNGDIYPKWMRITAVKDRDGNVTHYIGSHTDISETQKAYEQLQVAATHLTQANLQIEAERSGLVARVKERTSELQLANKAKDAFLATMSHEIRTPLGGLMGMMELLGLSELDSKQSELLKTARESAESLLRIVNDILDWSKIEAGKIELVPRTTSISMLLKNVSNTYSHIASEKGILLHWQVDDKLCHAHLLDSFRVNQILNNLVSNAIKFTAKGSVSLTAERCAQLGKMELVRFSITDSGIGISEEHLGRLFMQYEQASADTTRMYGGTGLGLSICHRLAELMGGELGVTSTLGVGTTFSFTVTLPTADLADQHELQRHVDAQATSLDASAQVQWMAEVSRARVLVVDDHPVNRMLITQQLEKLGIKPEIAEHGMEALSLWQAGQFDLIISDCHMPEMDGYELTRNIRRIEQLDERKPVPIIAWTANVLEQEAAHCHAVGMNDVLTKPTEISDLNAMLTKWLMKRTNTVHQAKPAAGMTALDQSVLGKFVSDRAEQVEMLQLFIGETNKDIAQMKAALEADAPQAIVEIAHRIKGACGLVGALELADVCLRIEQAAKQGDLVLASQLMGTELIESNVRFAEQLHRLGAVS